jgi:hypothetical protein
MNRTLRQALLLAFAASMAAAPAMAAAIEARGGALAPGSVNELRKLVQQMLRDTKSPRDRHESSPIEPSKRKRS